MMARTQEMLAGFGRFLGLVSLEEEELGIEETLRAKEGNQR